MNTATTAAGRSGRWRVPRLGRVAAATLAVGLAWPTSAQIVFRSRVESVSVNVSVRQRGRDVTDLLAADFTLRDNGLEQRILEISREALPIDVTFVVDLSGSVGGPLANAITRAIERVSGRLRPIDRAALLTFNNRIREIRPLTPGGLPAPVALGTPMGQTALFDALTVSLVAPPDRERRAMVILFTDGRDGSSFVDGSSLVDAARRVDTAVFTVALTEGTLRRRRPAAHEALFHELADTTGGVVAVLQQDEDLGTSFVQAFDDFRTSYVLRYAYDGPPHPGWHELSVHVARRGTYEVRARQGYFAAAAP